VLAKHGFNAAILPYCSSNTGVVVQLVRIPACHAGGRGFESRPLRQQYAAFREYAHHCVGVSHFILRKPPLPSCHRKTWSLQSRVRCRSRSGCGARPSARMGKQRERSDHRSAGKRVLPPPSSSASNSAGSQVAVKTACAHRRPKVRSAIESLAQLNFDPPHVGPTYPCGPVYSIAASSRRVKNSASSVGSCSPMPMVFRAIRSSQLQWVSIFKVTPNRHGSATSDP
jgi:hypothetical protein